ncbi:MAG: ATP-binding protein, partial [Proteobacteria bacterium]|nr:ATP-binding protein [Pseudomonadota bacterium]
KVILEEADTWAAGTVEDTGIGIPPEDQFRIFMEFYRTPRAKEMDHRGAGLGLPLVKRIVEGYEGTIEVDSTPGKGSRFVFKLPKLKSPKILPRES